jgi:hypothetical protein
MREAHEHPTHHAVIRTVRNLFSRPRGNECEIASSPGAVPPDIDGDVHVAPEDHVEWNAIGATLATYCYLLREDGFLICREQKLRAPVYHAFGASAPTCARAPAACDDLGGARVFPPGNVRLEFSLTTTGAIAA